MLDVLDQALRGEGGVDLHSHTTYPDGHWSPTGLVRDAVGLGVRVLAVTDHDNLLGLAEAGAEADHCGVALIRALEVTILHGTSLYHLLCYDVDPEDPVWSEVRRHREEANRGYYRRILELMREAGYDVRDEDVTHPDGSYVNHAATGAFACRRTRGLLPRSARASPITSSTVSVGAARHGLPSVRGAASARWALCVLAHAARAEPGVCVRATGKDVRELKELLPLIGLETFHPYHSQSAIAHCQALCAEHSLATTAGSDAHGWAIGRPPRSRPADLSAGLLERIRERWGLRGDARLKIASGRSRSAAVSD